MRTKDGENLETDRMEEEQHTSVVGSPDHGMIEPDKTDVTHPLPNHMETIILTTAS